jgi:DNA-binding NarL/FixJ family response regulator
MTNETTINVLIADDHPMIIDGLRMSLSNVSEVKIVADASDGESVVEALRKYPIDVILLDINMPGLNGFDTLRKIKPIFPNVKILILSMYGMPEFIRSVIKGGASGYLLKNTGKDELIEAIQKAQKGEIYYSRDVRQILKNEETSPTSSVHLTRREKEILRLIAMEKTTSEIADELFISTHTVDTHRKNLLSKLNVKNAAGLVKFALENGITRTF